jgi:hypothetical protein
MDTPDANILFDPKIMRNFGRKRLKPIFLEIKRRPKYLKNKTGKL